MSMSISLILVTAFLSIGKEQPLPKVQMNNQKLEVKISKEELKLYTIINKYRQGKHLPAIPLSKSLTYVAQMHSNDLATKNPSYGSCNIHSWSESTEWTSCCYTDDHAEASCMWNKPRELTNYSGNGYEISSAGSYTAVEAFSSWKSSSAHNAVMINEGIWKKANWNAIGIGMKDGFATVWFGKERDSAGEPTK